MLRSLATLPHHTIRRTHPTPSQITFSRHKSTKKKHVAKPGKRMYIPKRKKPPVEPTTEIEYEYVPAWKNLRPGSRLELHAKIHSLLRHERWRDAEDALNPALAKARQAKVHWQTAKATAERTVLPRIHYKTTYAVVRGSLAALNVKWLTLTSITRLRVGRELLKGPHLPVMGAAPLALIEHPSQWTANMWEEIITLMVTKGMYLEAMVWLEQVDTGRNEELWKLIAVAVGDELQHSSKGAHRVPYPKRSAVCAALRMLNFRCLEDKRDPRRRALPLSIYDTIEGFASPILSPETTKETLLWFSKDATERKLTARLLLDFLIRCDAPKVAVPYVADVIRAQTPKQFAELHQKKIDELIGNLLRVGIDDIDKLPSLPDSPLGFIDQHKEYFTAAQAHALGFEGALQLIYLAHSRLLPIQIQFHRKVIEKLLSRQMLYQAAVAVHMACEAYVLKRKAPKADVIRRQAFSAVVDTAVANLRQWTIEKGLALPESNAVVSEGEQPPEPISPFLLNQSVSAIVKSTHLLDLRGLPDGDIGNLFKGIYLVLKYDIAPEEVKEYLLNFIKRTVGHPPVFYKKYPVEPESRIVLRRIFVEILENPDLELKVPQKKVKTLAEQKPVEELAM
ncbi:hypothetical protein BDQ17DRAFT_886622 [Cyathus striatus]|nr:hypothetical protein BDQ17DRAFT_886622 [Cyathus striatus]